MKNYDFNYSNLTDVGWVAFYDYFKEFNFYKSEVKEIFEKYIKFLESGVFFSSIYTNVAVISRRPQFVKKNLQGRMHCENGPAIQWRDGYKLYFLNGVEFKEELYSKVIFPEFSFADRMKIEDVDQRTQAINPKFADIDNFIKEAKGILLDEVNKMDIEANPVNYKLYKFPKGEIFTEDAYYCYFDCPSTEKKHLEGVEISKTVAEAMAWACSNPEIGAVMSPEDWKLQVPLLHEN